MYYLNILFLSVLIFCSYFVQIWANPIVSYQQGKNGRAEIVHAIIHAKDLRTGEATSVNQKMAAEIRALGKTGDDCGHILANVLGGPMQKYNLFPQNSTINRGEFRTTVEAHMQYFLELDAAVDYSVDYYANLIYTTTSDTRPTQLQFSIRFLKDKKLVPFTDIPVSGKHRVPSNPYVGVVLNT